MVQQISQIGHSQLQIQDIIRYFFNKKNITTDTLRHSKTKIIY